MFQCIRQDILQDVQYLPFSLFTGVAVYLMLCIVSYLRRRNTDVSCKKLFFGRNFLVFLSVSYLTLMLYIVFLCREAGSRTDISLVLGETWTQDMQGRAYVIENIMLFVPVGVLASAWFVKAPVRKTLLCGGCFSLLIETAQYVTQRGYFQVDDLVTNLFGSLLGALFYVGLTSLARVTTKGKTSNNDGISLYK